MYACFALKVALTAKNGKNRAVSSKKKKRQKTDLGGGGCSPSSFTHERIVRIILLSLVLKQWTKNRGIYLHGKLKH